VARAKRTARADARRRHRVQFAPGEAPADVADGDEVIDAAPPAAGPARDPRRAAAATRQGIGAPERPAPAGGIRNALRLAFRPLELREDLRLLPRLIAHRAFWLPVLLAAVNAGALIAFQGRELITQFAMTYFLIPPPIGAIFLAGFLAPRASYLIGLLVGIVTSFLLAIVVAAVPSLFPPGATFGGALVQALLTSPIAGILFAAAAAWYRRFLYLASPARQLERRPAAPRGKPARGR
jgi:hypothetical protein